MTVGRYLNINSTQLLSKVAIMTSDELGVIVKVSLFSLQSSLNIDIKSVLTLSCLSS